MGEYMGTVMLLPTRIIYKDHLQLLPTNCYLQFLRILNSLPLWQTSTIPRKFLITSQKFPIIPRKIAIIMCQNLREKIPAHMIIQQKLKKEDTGTYDNTTDENTTENS